jgi:glyoxylase-like metal-dependent hydrolase (beta-lactamase superfamily II)
VSALSSSAEPIALELPVRYLGSVNVWLLRGEPLTLVDTGPFTEEVIETLELQLSLNGLSLSDIELVLLTHHHLDHTALADLIRERSGAKVAAHRGTAEWGQQFERRIADGRAFTRQVIAENGVPDALIPKVDHFFAQILAEGRPYATDIVLADGDAIDAGGRTWRTVWRPGHSLTDTLFVDDDADVALVGDHLLAKISSAVEMTPMALAGDERPRALMGYLGNLLKTQVMPLRRLYTGHGPVIDDHAALIDRRMAFHTERREQIQRLVEAGHASAFEIARGLWPEATVAASPVLVVWEVLGHLDLLVNRGRVREEVDDEGCHLFRAKRRRTPGRSPVTRTGDRSDSLSET